jgi:Mrp family chromosome partitioning ATPase
VTISASTNQTTSDGTQAAGRKAARHRPIGDYCAALLRRLDWPGDNASSLLRTLGVTGCRVGEGVSSVAAHMALTAAEYAGKQVLLIDAGMASPSVHRTFSVPVAPGLAEVMTRGVDPDDAIHVEAAGRLAVMSAGQIDGAMDREFDEQCLSNLLVALREQFDLIVFDLPPARGDHPSLRLAALLDGVVFVLHAQRGSWQRARGRIETLRQANVNLLGAVLNHL